MVSSDTPCFVHVAMGWNPVKVSEHFLYGVWYLKKLPISKTVQFRWQNNERVWSVRGVTLTGIKYDTREKNCPSATPRYAVTWLFTRKTPSYKTYTCQYLSHFSLEWQMFQTKVVEKAKTHILCSVSFFLKIMPPWDNVGKYCRVWQATDDNMAHVHCMQDTYGYKHTFRTCNIYCFSTTTMVIRTLFDIDEQNQIVIYVTAVFSLSFTSASKFIKCCSLHIAIFRAATLWFR
jgi:hypothetical protein